jgi:hypothetical protein
VGKWNHKRINEETKKLARDEKSQNTHLVHFFFFLISATPFVMSRDDFHRIIHSSSNSTNRKKDEE